MRRNISNVHCCVIGAPLFGSTLAPRRSIAFRISAGTWSRAPGKQFGVLGRWRDRHTRPARWSDVLRIRPVRWRKWNRIRIDLARLADPIHNIGNCCHHCVSYYKVYTPAKAHNYQMIVISIVVTVLYTFICRIQSLIVFGYNYLSIP